MVTMRFFLLVFCSFAFVPCYADELQFGSTYQYFLKGGRDIIMNSCAEGRLLNKKYDASYWSSSVQDKSREEMRKVGSSENDINTYLGAEANAMKDICPDVW
jgi:hypothetical protein